MKLESRPGIYRIYNTINGKYYVGSSRNIKRRKAEHFRMLRKGTHHNKHLQNSVLKYGIENFKFVVIEYCEQDEQFEREQVHLDSVIPSFTYNISTIAEGNNNPINMPSMKGENNPFFNKKHTKEARIRMGTKVSIDGIEYFSLTEAGNKLNMSRQMVHKRVNSNNFPDWQYI